MKKLNWGMVGGGEGSQIGPAHRISAAVDGLFSFAAGALDIDPDRGRSFALSFGSLLTGPMGTGGRCSRVNAFDRIVSIS